MNGLLSLTAMIEAATGLALLAVPSLVARLLLGSEMSAADLPVGRLTGVALLALGTICWFARDDIRSRATKGLMGALLLYNFGAVAILGNVGIGSQPGGIALWPAVILHAGMAAWCLIAVIQS